MILIGLMKILMVITGKRLMGEYLSFLIVSGSHWRKDIISVKRIL
ncbi:Uncharacterised protein [Yersinia bercovieri]|nr:Uncharacterised protein [Yersinia bercovieri]